MTRKSRRTLERQIRDLEPGDDDDDLPDEYVIQYDVVDPTGETIDTFERVVDLGGP